MMTEQEWLECAEPKAMLNYLQGKVSNRKFRMFTVACYRHIWQIISEDHIRAAIEIIERFADGLASQNEMRRATKQICWGGVKMAENPNTAPYLACQDAVRLACERAHLLEGGVISKEVAAQVSSLHDIFGNHFRPVIVNPVWLAWNNATVPKISLTIYEERRFQDLTILADALDEAGCTNADILSHCRSEGPHVRGCWVVDLLLGKE
jgi:hypothetical protein